MSTILSQSPLALLVLPTLAHDFQVLAVIIHMDVAPLRDRVHQLLVERPIHAAEDDPTVGDCGQPLELLERRDAAPRGPRTRAARGTAVVGCVVVAVLMIILLQLQPAKPPPGLRSTSKLVREILPDRERFDPLIGGVDDPDLDLDPAERSRVRRRIRRIDRRRERRTGRKPGWLTLH